MTLLAWGYLIVGSLIVGVACQWLMKSDMPYRWIVTSVATLAGAAASSEWLFSGTTPDVEGLAAWPAVIGGLVVGIVVDVAAQWFAGQQRHGTQGRGAAVR